jgi:hypothetical protein
VADGAFGEVADGAGDGALDGGLVEVVTSLLAGGGVGVEASGGEEVLPGGRRPAPEYLAATTASPSSPPKDVDFNAAITVRGVSLDGSADQADEVGQVPVRSAKPRPERTKEATRKGAEVGEGCRSRGRWR